MAISQGETEKRVLTAFTDPQRTLKSIPGRPSECNVFSLHNIFNPDEVNSISNECMDAKRGCVDCKRQLSDGINRYLEPLRERRKEYESRPDFITDILASGASKAKVIASQTIVEVRDRMGLI